MCKAARQLLNTAKQQRKASPTMTSHLAEAGRTLIPRKDDRYGLLSPALVILTFVAGLVDALSYLALGHVFVANVTGNIEFLGFAFAHAQGFVWWTSALTLATFMIGAFIADALFITLAPTARAICWCPRQSSWLLWQLRSSAFICSISLRLNRRWVALMLQPSPARHSPV